MTIPDKCWCETCHGNRYVLNNGLLVNAPDGYKVACPDCTDGLSPLGRRLLVRCGDCEDGRCKTFTPVMGREGFESWIKCNECGGTGWRLRPKAELLWELLEFVYETCTQVRITSHEASGLYEVVLMRYATEYGHSRGKTRLAALGKAVFGEPLEEETCQQT